MSENEGRRFKVVALGGTFDYLHEGHKALLRKAFEVGGEVIIGVTSDGYVRKPHKIDPYDVRVEGLKGFLEELGVLMRARIVPLDDPYGPTVTEEGVEAIVVSEETTSTAYEVNRIRRERGFEPLVIIAIDWVLAEDGRPISSTRVRRGVIDREGRLVRPDCN